MHSLEAVGVLKQATDKDYRYLNYRINNCQFNGQPDYVFRSSVPMAQLAIDMDQNGPDHPVDLPKMHILMAYHSIWTGFIALALFVYHTAMHHILRLGTMDSL